MTNRKPITAYDVARRILPRIIEVLETAVVFAALIAFLDLLIEFLRFA